MLPEPSADWGAGCQNPADRSLWRGPSLVDRLCAAAMTSDGWLLAFGVAAGASMTATALPGLPSALLLVGSKLLVEAGVVIWVCREHGAERRDDHALRMEAALRSPR